MKWILLSIAITFVLVVLFLFYKVLVPIQKNSSTFTPIPLSSNPPTEPIFQDPIIVAAGDIACQSLTPEKDSCQQQATADLISKINPQSVLALGDIQYDSATYDKLINYFDKSWGKFKDKIRPAPGNHDYSVAGAKGYYQYFGEQAHNGYYSFDVGKWHIISLNSNCGEAGGCEAKSSQYIWLEVDLASHKSQCTLAFWHHPLFSSGLHGSSIIMRSIWYLLYLNNVDLVLNGHDHLYERFVPQDRLGKSDNVQGLREFVVGTGGRNLYQVTNIIPNSEKRVTNEFGVLKLTLHDSNYDWQFININNQILDSGSDTCH